MRGLEPARSERDEAERTIRELVDDHRATKDDKLNAALSLIGIAQRRGDHRGALEQLDAIVDAGLEAELQISNLRATSLTQLGAYDDAAKLYDNLLTNPAAASASVSGWWELEAGRSYYLAGRTEDAIRVTKSAVSYFEKKENELEHLTRAKSNLAIFMLKSDRAEDVKQAEKILEETCNVKIAIGDAEGASTNFSQLSLHYFAQGRLEKAIAYGRKDLKLSQFVGDERSIAVTLSNMASIYLRALQLSEARTFVRKAAEIGKRLDNPDILDKCGKISQQIEELGRYASEHTIAIGKTAICPCGSSKKYVDCCGRADHEPVALRMPIGGPSEDIGDIRSALKGSGLEPLQLDFAMRDTKQSRQRISWSELRGHDGWFEIFELPDMANMHLNAAESLADQAAERVDAIHEPIACAMLTVSALEAFINSTIYFANEASKSRALSLPAELLADAFAYQRHTELTQKWDALGAALCVQWPPPPPIWTNFVKLVQLRNELVHYKAEGFSRVAPAERHPPGHLRNLPPEIVLRDIPSSWPVRLLTPSFARWSVSVANDLIRHFRSTYRFGLPVIDNK
jgi:tetratricopeptide (TPR) repeat protein